jgi:Ca2+-binding EF-hand superfamily protein
MRLTLALALAALASFPAAAQAQEPEKVAGFEALDTNGDGVIDADEWAAGSPKIAQAPAMPALDMDGDGRISPKEWRMWAEAGGATPGQDEDR